MPCYTILYYTIPKGVAAVLCSVLLKAVACAAGAAVQAEGTGRNQSKGTHYHVVAGSGSKGGRYWGTLGSLGEY